jgi:hypothetical protein
MELQTEKGLNLCENLRLKLEVRISLRDASSTLWGLLGKIVL